MGQRPGDEENAVVDLTESVMDLSRVGKTIDGESFAYLQLDCIGKNIGNVAILGNFQQLQEINLSDNCISDVSPLGALMYVLKLTLARNKITSVAAWNVDQLTHLLHLDLSGNLLETLPRLHLPALRHADFTRNRINTCGTFGGHPTLETLVIAENALLDLEGLRDSPKLETLDVSQNSVPAVVPEDEETQPEPARGVHSINGLKALPALKCLNLSKNIFETLEGEWSEMPMLERLIVAENAIAALPGLEPISGIKCLKELETTGNKLEEEANIRIESLICNPGLLSVNATPVEPEERDEAKQTNETRIQQQEEERARLAAEAEEAARAAAEAAAAAEAEGAAES